MRLTCSGRTLNDADLMGEGLSHRLFLTGIASKRINQVSRLGPFRGRRIPQVKGSYRIVAYIADSRILLLQYSLHRLVLPGFSILAQRIQPGDMLQVAVYLHHLVLVLAALVAILIADDGQQILGVALPAPVDNVLHLPCPFNGEQLPGLLPAVGKVAVPKVFFFR